MAKNTMWLILTVVAAIVGAMFGPTLLSGFSLGSVMLLLCLFLAAIVGYIIWALSSNRGAKPASAAARMDAKAMQPANGMGRVYVVRRGFVAALQGIDIEISGIASGQIKSGQQLMAELPQGNYQVTAGTAKTALARQGVMEVSLIAGEAIVIDAMFEMGALKGSIKLSRLKEGKAREDVAATRLMLWESGPNL